MVVCMVYIGEVIYVQHQISTVLLERAGDLCQR